MYNGHKRLHTIKFQTVVIPNGLIANLSGPYEGKRHDSLMRNQSGLLNDLRREAFYNGEPLCLYGHPAYPLGGGGGCTCKALAGMSISLLIR